MEGLNMLTDLHGLVWEGQQVGYLRETRGLFHCDGCDSDVAGLCHVVLVGTSETETKWCPDCLATVMGNGHRIMLGEDDGGRRAFLAGKPLHAGDMIEMRVPSGDWVRVRYESDLYVSYRPRIKIYAAPWGPTGPEVIVEQPERLTFRWRRSG